MPSPHHHYHHHHHHPPQIHTNPPSCCHSCCCCYCCCSDCSPPPYPSPQLTNSDELLKTLASHLLLLQSPSSPPPAPPNVYSSASYFNPHLSIHQKLPKDDQILLHHRHHQHQQQQHHPQPSLLHPLLHRIAALESSLPHLSSPPPQPPASSLPKQHKHPPPHQRPIAASTSLRSSLRNVAARTIQAAFRRFLVRRSQTLRDLKELAAVESHVAALRSALSDKGSHDPKALSDKAMGLLLRLDSIQSGEPMIRHGKRSISKELVRMLDFIDKVLVKEHQLSLGAPDFEENAADGRQIMEDLSRGLKANEKIVKLTRKKVSFFENENGSGVSLDAHEQFPEEFRDAGDKSGHVDSLGREFTDIEIRDHLVSQGFRQVSDDERSSEGSSVENGGSYLKDKHLKVQNGKLGLAAPLPLQMEPRRTPF